MAETATVTETEILAEVIVPDQGDLPPQVAQSVLQWKFPEATVARMNALADRNSRGAITPAERDELEKYLRVGSLVNLMQAKARLSLKKPDATSD